MADAWYGDDFFKNLTKEAYTIDLPDIGLVEIRRTEELDKELKGTTQGACAHIEMRLVEVTHSDNTKHFRHQCQCCGYMDIKMVAKSEVSGKPPLQNIALISKFKTNGSRFRLQLLRDAYGEQQYHLKGYDEYLNSEEWARKRRLVFKRAAGICEGCLDNEAEVVHHKSYSHIGTELMFDLVALCRFCHKKCHPEK